MGKSYKIEISKKKTFDKFLLQGKLHVLLVKLEPNQIKVPAVVLNVKQEHSRNQVQVHVSIVQMDIHL